MVNVSVARRYARALLEVSGGAADKVLEELTSLVSALETSAELSEVVTNPAYTQAQRNAVIEGLLSASGAVEPALANTVRLLVHRNRMAYLPDIARAFRDLTDAKAGRVRGKVVSAVPLPTETLDTLASNLEKLTQKKVVLEAKVNRAVLGGVSAQVGSWVYDGTLKNQLEELRQTLKVR